MSIAKDGAELKEVARTEVISRSPILVGLAVCSHKAEASDTVVFSDVSVEQLAAAASQEAVAFAPLPRDFLTVAGASSLAVPAAIDTPRWRGFNLQEKFTDRPAEWAQVDPEWGRTTSPFVETDFEWMAHWGFNFVRLPMSYRCWTDPQEPFQLLEPTLQEIDQAVEWGRQYGVHVCLNFHRAPGFCINWSLSPEPWNLWSDAKAQDIFDFQWSQLCASGTKEFPAAD